MSASRFSIYLILAASLSTAACSKGGGAAKEDLALVPKDAEVVIGINIARMRSSAMWKKLLDLGVSGDKAKKDYEDFNKNCVDVGSAEGPETVFIAIPEPSKVTKDGVAIIRLKSSIDDGKLSKCLEYLGTKNGEKVASADYNGKKIWSTTKEAKGDGGGLSLLDGKTIAFGSGAWIRKTIDLQAGKETASAKQNPDLLALVKRTKSTDAIWGAGTVPQSARDSFKGNPQLAPMATLKAVFGSIDFAAGLAVDANLDLGSDADAKALNEQATTQIAEAKKMPQVMMLGLGSVFEGLKNEAKGSTFRVIMNYNQQQVDEMVARVQGLMKSFGGALGGGGMGGPPPGMGMGGPPPGMGGMGGPPPGMGGMGGPPPGMGGPPHGMAAPGLGTPSLNAPAPK